MLLIVIGLLALSFLATLVLSCRSVGTRIIASICALGLAAFCAFGFLVSYELSDSAKWPWQLTYGVMGSGALLAALLLLRGIRRRNTPTDITDSKSG